MRAYDVSFLRWGTACVRAPTPTTRPSSPSWRRWSELTQVAWKHGVQVIEAPATCRCKIKANMDKQLATVAVLHAGAAHHRHRPRLRPHHLRHRRGDDRLAPRCSYVTPKEPRPAGSRGREAGGDRLQDRPYVLAKETTHPGSGTTRSREYAEFRWEDQFNLGLDPETARTFHDETLPQGSPQGRPLLLHVRPEVLLDEDQPGSPRPGKAVARGWRMAEKFGSADEEIWRTKARSRAHPASTSAALQAPEPRRWARRLQLGCLRPRRRRLLLRQPSRGSCNRVRSLSVCAC